MPEPLKMNIVGWRHVTQSFAMVNQWQILSLLKRDDVTLSHVDARLPTDKWSAEVGAFGREDTAAISALRPPTKVPDIEYRISFPFDVTPSTGPAMVFGVTENGHFPAGYVRGGVLTDLNGRDNMRFVVPSRWARDRFLDNGVEKASIEVIPHGVDAGVFRFDPDLRASVRQELGLSGFVFLHVGSLMGTKGTELLFDAFGAVLERGVKATLLLKGSDGLYDSKRRLKALLDRMSSSRRSLVLHNLKYVGRALDVTWMAGLYNAADGYVSPYLAEGFNIPVLEAMAVGLPVLVTGGGPTDDFTTDAMRRNISARLDDSDGKLRFRPFLDSIVELMASLPGDQAFLDSARQSGPLQVQAGYLWDQIAGQLVGLARRLI